MRTRDACGDPAFVSGGRRFAGGTHPHLDRIVIQTTARDEFNTLVLGIFAFAAILLASIGLYGLMAYSVEQRTLEFGIRLALGANFPQLRNMIVRQAMLLAGIGIAIGLATAFALTRLMASLLFHVKPGSKLVPECIVPGFSVRSGSVVWDGFVFPRFL